MTLAEDLKKLVDDSEALVKQLEDKPAVASDIYAVRLATLLESVIPAYWEPNHPQADLFKQAWVTLEAFHGARS